MRQLPAFVKYSVIRAALERKLLTYFFFFSRKKSQKSQSFEMTLDFHEAQELPQVDFGVGAGS